MPGIAGVRDVEFRFTTITVLYFLSGLVGAEVVRRLWPRRKGPGGWPLLGLLASASWWCFASALEAASVGISSKVFWSQASYVGVVTCSPLFLLFALRFADLQRVLVRGVRLAIYLLPAVFLAIAWTNEWHGWLWPGYQPAAEDNMIVYLHGPAFWVIIGYSYLALLVATFVLAGAALRLRGIHRSQAVAVLMGLPLPWLASALYISGLSPLPSVDFTPLAMTGAGLLLAFAVVRLQLIDLMPIAHERIFEALEDGLLVLDPKDRVVEANAAVQHLLGNPGRTIVGRMLEETSRTLMEFAPAEGRIEIRVGEPPRDLDVRVLPLRGADGNSLGRLVVLHDVTARKRIEEELARKRRELEILATTDALTGLYNRRHADAVMAAEVRRTVRYGTPLSVAMADIDHFKEINDRFGHERGDGALKHVAQHLRRGTRSTDVVCRYGGEEFLILLTHTGPGEAFGVMERLRKTLCADPDPATGECLAVSIGVASWKTGQDVFDFVRGADARMYQAKGTGRNRVIGEDGLEA
jgi:diguanylate cyclase (GGDEF)-like protein